MYKASKIICGDNLHLILDRNEKRNLEVIEGTSIFLKILIQEKAPPVRLNFDYFDSKKSDLKVCISRKTKKPNHTNSEKVFNKPA